MDSSDRVFAIFRNSIIIAVLTMVPVYILNELFEFYRIKLNYNRSEEDTGLLFFLLWVFFVSILFATFSVTKVFSFINNKIEPGSTISYIILGVLANTLGFFVAWGITHSLYLSN